MLLFVLVALRLHLQHCATLSLQQHHTMATAAAITTTTLPDDCGQLAYNKALLDFFKVGARAAALLAAAAGGVGGPLQVVQVWVCSK